MNALYLVSVSVRFGIRQVWYTSIIYGLIVNLKSYIGGLFDSIHDLFQKNFVNTALVFAFFMQKERMYGQSCRQL